MSKASGKIDHNSNKYFKHIKLSCLCVTAAENLSKYSGLS